MNKLTSDVKVSGILRINRGQYDTHRDVRDEGSGGSVCSNGQKQHDKETKREERGEMDVNSKQQLTEREVKFGGTINSEILQLLADKLPSESFSTSDCSSVLCDTTKTFTEVDWEISSCSIKLYAKSSSVKLEAPSTLRDLRAHRAAQQRSNEEGNRGSKCKDGLCEQVNRAKPLGSDGKADKRLRDTSNRVNEDGICSTSSSAPQRDSEDRTGNCEKESHVFNLLPSRKRSSRRGAERDKDTRGHPLKRSSRRPCDCN
jgi:hypothetical protein